MTLFRTLRLFLVSSLLTSLPMYAQKVPQTARQALTEMLFSKTAGTFNKHLPEALQAALRQAPPGSIGGMINGLSLLTSQMQTQPKQSQTFDSGPMLWVTEDQQAHTKFEAIVERDDLQGDEDDIELSFRAYKDGELQTAGLTSRLTFGMKQEMGIWRLSQFTFSLQISLTDPALLKAMTTQVQPPATTMTAAQSPFGTNMATPNAALSLSASAGAASENLALASVRAVKAAQITYAATYPAHGFACSLTDLGGMGNTTSDEHHARLIEPRLASGRKNGYMFTLMGCDTMPATKYQIFATPIDKTAGLRVFCTDESGLIRSTDAATGALCLATGKSLQN
jgi:hypothetical protein